ncbi:hypothetical protein ASZ90_002816 [hydrocarbon metagenome]|uniref:Uncharacterized protein n=1 Tax=hydrocarbon metagenome TaxID=938273 RepID=A0A0W8G2E5_9ZZZZ
MGGVDSFGRWRFGPGRANSTYVNARARARNKSIAGGAKKTPPGGVPVSVRANESVQGETPHARSFSRKTIGLGRTIRRRIRPCHAPATLATATVVFDREFP